MPYAEEVFFKCEPEDIESVVHAARKKLLKSKRKGFGNTVWENFDEKGIISDGGYGVWTVIYNYSPSRKEGFVGISTGTPTSYADGICRDHFAEFVDRVLRGEESEV